jgi:hypothetical protein
LHDLKPLLAKFFNGLALRFVGPSSAPGCFSTTSSILSIRRMAFLSISNRFSLATRNLHLSDRGNLPDQYTFHASYCIRVGCSGSQLIHPVTFDHNPDNRAQR